MKPEDNKKQEELNNEQLDNVAGGRFYPGGEDEYPEPIGQVH